MSYIVDVASSTAPCCQHNMYMSVWLKTLCLRMRLHGSSQMHAAVKYQLCGCPVSATTLVEVRMHAPFGAMPLRTMLNDLMWQAALATRRSHHTLLPFKFLKPHTG